MTGKKGNAGSPPWEEAGMADPNWKTATHMFPIVPSLSQGDLFDRTLNSQK